MALINCCFYRVEYLTEFNTVHLIFKGEVDLDQIVKLRNMLDGLSESLKIEKLILDFTECNKAFIDYNSHIRFAFWENLENHGLKMILLIIPPKNYKIDARSAWESYFIKNKLKIRVMAISDRKLMPLFIMKENLTTQLN